jgi:hypothetical protein
MIKNATNKQKGSTTFSLKRQQYKEQFLAAATANSFK